MHQVEHGGVNTDNAAQRGVSGLYRHSGIGIQASCLGVCTLLPEGAMDSLDSVPGTEITALLGRGTRFEGKLFFEGRVRIDGSFKGEIRSEDTLIIGDGAEVQAEIDVATVIVRGGAVHGNVRAKTAIEIHAPGKLVGNIQSPSLFIERGVEFQGSCQMDASEPTDAARAERRDAPTTQTARA
jgi:cytoskeletal protein CcmA (bactofilin family)